MKNLVVIIVSASVSTACATVAVPATPLLEQCSGTYTCTDPVSPVVLVFEKDGDACTANGIAFHQDGTCDLSGCAWSGDSASFQTCFGSDCSTCTPMAPPSKADAGSSTGGTCVGTPNDCGEETPPYCSNTRGCYMATRVKYDNSFDNYCAGYGDSCDEMDTENDCKKQGCTWKS